MKLKYKDFDEQDCEEELASIVVPEFILHTTPDENVKSILENGIKLGMPRNKRLLDINAIFCTIPSLTPNPNDLFRYYDDWSIVVIDTSKIPNHKWYVDIFATEDPSNNGSNKHIMTFEDIPKNAINKVIK